MYYIGLLLYNKHGSHIALAPYQSTKKGEKPIWFFPHYTLSPDQQDADEIEILYDIAQEQLNVLLIPETIAYIHTYVLDDPYQENREFYLSLYTGETTGELENNIIWWSNGETTYNSNQKSIGQQGNKLDLHPSMKIVGKDLQQRGLLDE